MQNLNVASSNLVSLLRTVGSYIMSRGVVVTLNACHFSACNLVHRTGVQMFLRLPALEDAVLWELLWLEYTIVLNDFETLSSDYLCTLTEI